MPDVFISYNREDRETARLVANALEAEGFSVWWDAALRAGEAYDEVTEQNLRQAGAVVVLWSKRSANSKWVRAEATVGERSSTLVPVLIEDCERPIRFELVQTADLRHWRGDRADPPWRAFIQDVKTAISRRGAKPAAAAASNAAQDASIETTFWNSIKDGKDRSDFEAYLKRYPQGHFVALANNRLAALSKMAPSPQARAPAAAQPQRPAQPSPPKRASQARQAAPAKKSVSGLIVAGVAAGVAALGAAAFLMLSPGQKAPVEDTAVAAVEPAPQIAAAIPKTNPPTDIDNAAPESIEASADAPPPDVYGEADAPATLASVMEPSGPAEAEVQHSPAVLAEAPPVAPSEPGIEAKAAKVRTAKTYRDCDSCPLMAKLPKGSFVMGSPGDEPGRNAYEGPQRVVKLEPFAIGVYEVTLAEWNACAEDGACPKKTGDEEFPALGVSWREASAFAEWLSKKTTRDYRLPTEAEWEYAARAGTVTAYWWDDGFEKARIATGSVRAVGSADANAYGLYDVLGNAREWVADCYVNNYAKAPADGSAVTDGDCGKRVIRGGAWSSSPADLRVANRSRVDVDVHAGYMGVRLAADGK